MSQLTLWKNQFSFKLVGIRIFLCWFDMEMTHFISSFIRLEWLVWGSLMVAQITTWLHVWQITRMTSFPKGVWDLGTRLRTAMDEEVKLPSMCDHEQNCGFILSGITTEVIWKYAINTVTIAHLDTDRETIQVNMLQASKLTRVHQSAWFSKVHINSVKLDVRSLEWDDTCCVTCAWGTLDRNRKFSEIKHSKMLKLVRDLRCHSNFAKQALLLDSPRQNSPKRPYFTKVGDYIGDF